MQRRPGDIMGGYAGNSQVENETNKVAKDIVSDLNSQLKIDNI